MHRPIELTLQSRYSSQAIELPLMAEERFRKLYSHCPLVSPPNSYKYSDTPMKWNGIFALLSILGTTSGIPILTLLAYRHRKDDASQLSVANNPLNTRARLRHYLERVRRIWESAPFYFLNAMIPHGHMLRHSLAIFTTSYIALIFYFPSFKVQPHKTM